MHDEVDGAEYNAADPLGWLRRTVLLPWCDGRALVNWA